MTPRSQPPRGSFTRWDWWKLAGAFSGAMAITVGSICSFGYQYSKEVITRLTVLETRVGEVSSRLTQVEGGVHRLQVDVGVLAAQKDGRRAEIPIVVPQRGN